MRKCAKCGQDINRHNTSNLSAVRWERSTVLCGLCYVQAQAVERERRGFQ